MTGEGLVFQSGHVGRKAGCKNWDTFTGGDYLSGAPPFREKGGASNFAQTRTQPTKQPFAEGGLQSGLNFGNRLTPVEKRPGGGEVPFTSG